jgi:hypothetical protein
VAKEAIKMFKKPVFKSPIPLQHAAPPPTGPVSSSARTRALILAVVVPNVVALLGMVTHLTFNAYDHAGPPRSDSYFLAELVLIPLVMGLCASFCLRHTATGIGANIAISFANTAIPILLCALILHDYLLWLIFAIFISPPCFCVMALCGLIGRLLYRRKARKFGLELTTRSD